MLITVVVVIVILIAIALLVMLMAVPRCSLLSRLHKAGSQVVEVCGYVVPDSKLEEEPQSTSRTIFREVPVVRLRLRRPTGEYFTFETLLLVYLHELSHLLCPNTGHTPEFVAIENRLVQMATELGYITAFAQIEKDYPRLEHGF